MFSTKGVSGQPQETSDGIFPLLETKDNDPTSDWSELQSSDSENDARSNCSEIDGFVKHSFEVLFAPDTDVQRVTGQSE